MDHVTADRAAQTEQPGAHAAGQHQVTGQDGAYRKIMGIDIGGTGMKGGIVRVGDHPKSGQLKGDRFRIPSELRTSSAGPQQTESQAVRMEGVVQNNPTGTGSCSTVGASGGTGCFVRQATTAKAEAKARDRAQRDLPLP